MRSFGFFAIAALCLPAAAQTPNANTAFTASRIQSGGQPVTGTLTIKAVDPNGIPSALTTADGYFDGQDQNGNLFVVPVTAGALPNGFTVPDQNTAAFTRPAANRYQVDVYGVPAGAVKPDTRPLFEVILPAGTVTGSTFAFDKYAPVQVAAVLPAGLVAGPTVPARCLAPSLFYPTSPDANGNYRLGKCVNAAYVFDSSTGNGGGNGTPGANGTNFLQSNGAPGSTLGNVGDSDLDYTTGNLYLKLSGGWTQTGNLKGSAGAPGTPGTPGAAGQGFNFRGAWAPSTAYKPYDVVTYSGSTYEASTAFTSGATFNASNWNVFAAQGQQGAPGTPGAGGGSNPAIPANNIDVTAAPYYASPYGATTTTTSASVASGATSVPVTSASTFAVGNGILVTGGGSTGWTGSDYIGTVTAVSGNTLTVKPALSATAESGAVVKHDDSAALNAISTFCTTSDCGVYFPPIPGTAAGLYRVNGPVLDPSHSNAIVVLPNAALANGTGTAFRMYGSTRPVSGANATGILTDYNLSTAANLFGVYVGGSVIPGFSNTYFSMGNLRLIDNTTNPNLTLLDCTFCKGFTLEGSTWFMSNSPGANTSGAGFGFKQPSISNDVDVSVGTATVVGFANLMRLGEHSVNLSLHGANTSNGYVFDSATGNQGFNGHENTVTVANLWSQSSNSCISGGTSKQVLQVQSADCETNVTYICNDPNNYLYGDVHFQVPYTSLNPRSTDSQLTAAPSVNGCANLRLWNMHTGVCYGSTCPPVATPNTATLANGMIERWKMQDGSGTTNANAVDSSNPLTATNVTYASATGYTGATATFNGTSSYSRAGNQMVAQFTGATPFEACIWHSPSSVANGDHWLMGTLTAPTSLVSGWGIEDGYTSGNNLVYLANSSSNYIAVNFASGMTAGNRYLVCASYDGSKTAAGVSLYVNNVAVSGSIVKDAFGSGTITPSGAFTIGARADSTAAGFWGGSLADAILWNRQLTTSERAALYNAGPGGF